jgi:hypothetical protein
VKDPLKRDLSSEKEAFNEVVDRVIREYNDKKFKRLEPPVASQLRVIKLEPMKPTKIVGGLFGFPKWQ